MRAIPVLPIGPVNLKTGKNHMITPLEDWANSAVMVVQDMDVGTLRAIAGSGSVTSLQTQFPKGKSIEVCHDQTRKRIGSYMHTVLSHHPVTEAGFYMIQQAYGVTSIQMGTLK